MVQAILEFLERSEGGAQKGDLARAERGLQHDGRRHHRHAFFRVLPFFHGCRFLLGYHSD